MAQQTNGAVQLGEISTIRDILMGQQMSEYESRFKELEAYMQAAEQRLRAQIDTLAGDNSKQLQQVETQAQQRLGSVEKRISEQFDELETLANNRFTQLEKLLASNTERLQQEIKQTSQQDRHRIGSLLLNIGNQLLEE